MKTLKIILLMSKTKSDKLKFLALILKREVSDRLLQDFKNIFTKSKSCQVMNKTAYKKCWTPVGHKLWPLKHSIFNSIDMQTI
jgi:hypothetical protein